MILRHDPLLVKGFYNRFLADIWILMIYIEWIAAVINDPYFK